MRSLNAVPDRSSGPEHGRWARVRRGAEELTPETIEKIAQRIVALLHESNSDEGNRARMAGLLDASELARHLGVTRTWVYEHANQLGAIRLGTGSKARLRFDLDTATASMKARRREGQPQITTRGRRRPPKRVPTSTTPLLPISPQRTRGVLSWLVRAQRRGRR